MKTCVVIPSFNGAKTIGFLTQRVRALNLEVVVIDDGSSDGTSEAAKLSGAVTLRNEINLGKGVSLREGFAYCLGQGYELVITMDGDGQHLPEDIGNFLKALTDNPSLSMIIGNRMQSPQGMPLLRKATNRLLSLIVSGICRQWIPDSQNGFRLIKSSLLKGLSLKSNRFEIESEIILEAAMAGAKIANIEIKTVYEGHSSLIHPLKDTWRFIKFIFPYLGYALIGRSGSAESNSAYL